MSDLNLPWGAAGEENRQKRPTFLGGWMFVIIWKSYIWMWVDIPEKKEILTEKRWH
jgi:hypothetical protein